MLRTPTKKSGIASKLSPSPSSPPVSPFGFFCTSTWPACANASVTIAKAIPPTRRLIRAEHERHEDPCQRHDEQRLDEAPLPLRQRDRHQVDADREVERVPEREQAREPEEQVVGQRDPREREAEREQPERAGAVERAAEDHRDVEREQRQDGEDRTGAPRARGAAATRLNGPPSERAPRASAAARSRAGARPRGRRARSTRSSSRTAGSDRPRPPRRRCRRSSRSRR